MSYQYTKNNNGETDLVISGWENGIADSPFKGIGNIRNLSVRYYDGVAYMNYKRQLASVASTTGATIRNFTVTVASPAVFTAANHGLVAGNVLLFTTTGALPTGLSVGVPYYVISSGLMTNSFEVSTTLGGSAVNTSGSQSGTQTFTITINAPAYSCKSPTGRIYISDTAGLIYQQSAVDSTQFNTISGCPGTPNQGLQFWNNYLFAWDTTQINICGDGTGDAGVTSSNWNTSTATTGVWPIKSATIALTGSPVAGDTSATISSYTDAQGTSRAFWNGPTGTYPLRVTFSSGNQIVYANLTQGSTAITWYPALNSNSSSGNVSVQPMQGVSPHPSLVSINDGNLYFANDYYVGSFELLANQVFVKGNMITFNVNLAALSLPPAETVVALTELRNLLLVGANYKIYPWDRFSPQWQNPIPMTEKMYGMINILNNVYVFAGNKGSIYLSNGYSVSPFKKLPDNIAGVIDPSWNWGGIMTHRQRLYFQALAMNSATGVPIIAGVFSLGLVNAASSVSSEMPGNLTMEAQNSFGLVSSSTTSAGLLIDNNDANLSYDNYYSAWNDIYAGIDYNNTTLWSNNEAVIETDIVPIGTYLTPKTFASAEFKLDQPMKSGDSISLYARQSLSDTYTLIGTTTDTVLSFANQSIPFQNWQWFQFKITMSCNSTATSSSFNRLREVRIR